MIGSFTNRIEFEANLYERVVERTYSFTNLPIYVENTSK
jgi:hypothetical protein